jgi:hypothetical protein
MRCVNIGGIQREKELSFRCVVLGVMYHELLRQKAGLLFKSNIYRSRRFVSHSVHF